jgi:hypothetical protein
MLNEHRHLEDSVLTTEQEAEFRTVLLRLLRLVAAKIAKELRMQADLAQSSKGDAINSACNGADHPGEL